MTVYSVYARQHEAPAVVADRFSWFAALLPPVHALVYGLWLLLAGWIVAVLGVVIVAALLGAEAAFWAYALVAAFIGFEAPSLRRAKLQRSGWCYRAEIVAPDEDAAMLEATRQS